MAKKKEKKNKVTKETGLRRIGKEFGAPRKFGKVGDNCKISINKRSISAKFSFGEQSSEKESVVIYPTTGTRIRFKIDNIWNYEDDDLLEEEEEIIDYEEVYAWDDEDE